MASDAKFPLSRILLVVVLVCAAGALAWWQFGNRTPALVARVKSGTAVNAVSGTLIVQASSQQDIKSEISGRVIDIPVKLDQAVRVGDVLLRLDSGDLVLEIERTQSELSAAKRRLELASVVPVELQNANDALAEAQRQLTAGFVSETDVLRRRREVLALEQKRDQELITRRLEVEGLENQLKARNRQLDKMTLRAPFDGIIAALRTSQGDLISAGTPIGRIISADRLVEGRLSEENFAGVRVGQKAFVSFLPYGSDKQFSAKVALVLSSSDPETQRYLVHLELADSQLETAKLIPGITGDLSIILAERPTAALIPRRALFGSSVYVIKGGRIELRSVRTGFVNLTAVEVLEGLAENDLVVIGDVDRFSPGQAVSTELTTDTRWQ